MDFYAVLDQVLDLLRQRGRVTYNALKRQFGLDDAYLQDLKDEIIAAQHVAMDEDGKVLVWTGPPSRSRRPAPRRQPQRQGRWRILHPILPRRSSPPAVPWKASANRSLCCLPTSKALRS